MEDVSHSVCTERRRGWLHKIAILACLSLVTAISRADGQPIEYQVKAAFLLNFTKFVEWPPAAFPQPTSPISICILGADPFGNTLDQLVAGETVNERRLAVQRIKSPPPPGSCQVLFVNKSDKESPKLLASLGPGVLTVGDEETFLRDGGMIAFVIENRRVRFSVNQTAAENAGLKLSSRLLRVAKTVEK